MTLPSSGPLAFTDIQTEFGGSNPIGLNEYYAGGSYVPAGTTGTYGAVPSSGQIGVQNFYGTTAFTPVYIEEVFSTYLYTGNGSTQTITNGIDLSTKGGLVWTKSRSNPYSHLLYDTARGAGKYLISNSTSASQTNSDTLVSFNSTGFTLGPSDGSNSTDGTAQGASWTFRKQPKFFDVVTFTGTQNYGGSGQTVSHNLGSTPGCIIIKPLSDTSGSGFTLNDWIVYHRGLSSPTTQFLKLNSTASIDGNSDKVRAVSSTTFTAGWEVGLNGIQYIAYVFAHDAGGFGLTGTDNVISCGSFTTDGSGNATVGLGYEPQFAILKRTNGASDWEMLDNMRKWSQTGFKDLFANSSSTENNTNSSYCVINSTGFSTPTAGFFYPSSTYIYIAVRRGPMKVPTDATKVFSPAAVNNGGTTATITAGFPVDVTLNGLRNTASGVYDTDRLRGTQVNNYAFLRTPQTNAEYVLYNTGGAGFGLDNNVGVVDTNFWTGSGPAFYWNFRRAPSFFDEVCYTGTGSTPQNINHNLGVAPELMIVKVRSVSGDDWAVYCSHLTDANIVNLRLNKTQAIDYNGDMWDATTPTATTFRVGQSVLSNYGSQKLVAYLFATCAGVSKVGKYTGTGATQTISCGFTGGARWVMVKRTDSTGDWYVWDTARGMVAGTDPSLTMNNVAVESNANSVYTTTGGFQIVSTAADINASGGTYIYLAIA